MWYARIRITMLQYIQTYFLFFALGRKQRICRCVEFIRHVAMIRTIASQVSYFDLEQATLVIHLRRVVNRCPGVKANIYLSLATLHLKKFMPYDALAYATKALPYVSQKLEKHDVTVDEFRLCAVLATAYDRIGKRDEASEYITRASSIFHADDHRDLYDFVIDVTVLRIKYAIAKGSKTDIVIECANASRIHNAISAMKEGHRRMRDMSLFTCRVELLHHIHMAYSVCDNMLDPRDTSLGLLRDILNEYDAGTQHIIRNTKTMWVTAQALCYVREFAAASKLYMAFIYIIEDYTPVPQQEMMDALVGITKCYLKSDMMRDKLSLHYMLTVVWHLCNLKIVEADLRDYGMPFNSAKYVLAQLLLKLYTTRPRVVIIKV